MRLAGASFTGWAERPDDDAFSKVMHHAVALLRGEELSPEEADERRERLLAGFRWILVDEYQDIGAEQYELISALAGRTLEEDEGKLTLFAVGDDDQNIYAFNGASVEFIRRFESDYGPKPVYLTANYRSTGCIVAAANAIIEPAENRMKKEYPIHVDRTREGDSSGGEWSALDPVSCGRVQILPAGGDPIHQARAVMAEMLRLSERVSTWDWSGCAVIAREWEYLVPVRAFCEEFSVPVQMANEDIPGFWRLRETRMFVEWLRRRVPRVVDGASLRDWTDAQPSGSWHDLLRQAVEEHALENGDGEIPVDHFIEWLAEWGRDIRRRQRGLLLLTAHRAKGLEFDYVVVLDGGWDRVGRREDSDAPRRLYYVAMTRARQTLTLAHLNGSRGFQDELVGRAMTVRREAAELPPCSKAVEYRHVRLTLQDVDLGYAGRRRARDPAHATIRALSTGDRLHVRTESDGRWVLLDERNRVVGRLAGSFEPPSGMRCCKASVFALVGWSREASDPKYHDAIKCDAWEVVMPELVFEPDR